MSIQVNGNAPSINWEALLQQVGSLSQSAAAGQKPVLTFTTTEADGTQRTVSVNIPDDLSLPSTVDQAAIDSLCAKLAADPNLGLDARQIQQLHDDFTAALNAPGVQTSINSLGSSKSVMFDLYKLMALLVEVAQKQRDASRELRKTESEQIQASILAQAAQQRQTAKISMVASAICCAVQAGAMGLSLAKQASAFKTQMASLETSGVGSARENLTMLKAGESVDGARQQLAATRASVGNVTATRVTASFSQAELSRANAQLKEIQIQDDTAKLQNLQNVNQPVRPADIPSHPDLETANTRLNEFHEMQELQNNQNRSPEQNTRLTELQNKFHNTTEAKLTNERNAASLDSANTRLNEFHEMQDLEGTQNRTQAQETRLAELQGKFQNVNENQLTTELNNARQQVVADLQHNIEANQTELTNARADANAKLNATLKTYEDAYDTAVRERANVSPKASKLEVRDLDANYDKAAAELKFARAYVASERADITTAAQRQQLTAQGEVRLSEAQAMLKGDTSYIKAGQVIQRGEGVNALINSVGTCLQNMIQSWNTMQQAEVTELSAIEKQKQEELDQMKDLFSQAGDLVQAAIQLMQAVASAETQSMRDAIQV